MQVHIRKTTCLPLFQYSEWTISWYNGMHYVYLRMSMTVVCVHITWMSSDHMCYMHDQCLYQNRAEWQSIVTFVYLLSNFLLIFNLGILLHVSAAMCHLQTFFLLMFFLVMSILFNGITSPGKNIDKKKIWRCHIAAETCNKIPRLNIRRKLDKRYTNDYSTLWPCILLKQLRIFSLERM